MIKNDVRYALIIESWRFILMWYFLWKIEWVIVIENAQIWGAKHDNRIDVTAYINFEAILLKLSLAMRRE